MFKKAKDRNYNYNLYCLLKVTEQEKRIPLLVDLVSAIILHQFVFLLFQLPFDSISISGILLRSSARLGLDKSYSRLWLLHRVTG